MSLDKGCAARNTKGHVSTQGDSQRQANSPRQLWHLHKAEHIHTCSRLWSEREREKKRSPNAPHSASMVRSAFPRGKKRWLIQKNERKQDAEELFQDRGGGISPVAGACARLSDRRVPFAEVPQIHKPWNRIWQRRFPGCILQSMPLSAALSQLYFISIAVEWRAEAVQ